MSISRPVSLAKADAPTPAGTPLRLVEAIGHPALRAVRAGRALLYSITSSARNRIDGDMARPSAVAVVLEQPDRPTGSAKNQG